MKHAVAVQKRNVRQYEKQANKVSMTRDALNAKKTRQKAMAEVRGGGRGGGGEGQREGS